MKVHHPDSTVIKMLPQLLHLYFFFFNLLKNFKAIPDIMSSPMYTSISI